MATNPDGNTRSTSISNFGDEGKIGNGKGGSDEHS